MGEATGTAVQAAAKLTIQATGEVAKAAAPIAKWVALRCLHLRSLPEVHAAAPGAYPGP